jgi:hypothetical protein
MRANVRVTTSLECLGGLDENRLVTRRGSKRSTITAT